MTQSAVVAAQAQEGMSSNPQQRIKAVVKVNACRQEDPVAC